MPLSRYKSLIRRLLTASCLLLVGVGDELRGAESPIDLARSELYATYAAELATLADRCQKAGLDEQSKAIRRWLPKRESGKSHLFVLAEVPPLATTEKGAPAAQVECLNAWNRLRRQQAARLFKLAQKAITAERISLAYELVMEGAREDPINKKLRRLLGDQQADGRWVSSYAAGRLDRGFVDHPKFGWILKSHVKRYEGGQRRYKSRWLTAEKADEIMAENLDRGWTVQTQHYDIKTNDAWEKAVALGRRLERLHAVWRQVFVRYYAADTEIRRLVTGRQPLRGGTKRHKVVFFRSRDQYNAMLRKSQPRIEITLGIYFDHAHTAYFFAGDDQNDTTLFHEATHQLFQESRPVAHKIAQDNNFWIVEGIACYMESLTKAGGCYTLGGREEGRVPAARVRLLEDGFYVPLAELTAMGMKPLQRDKRIAKLYSQSAGLTAFLMHSGDGRYRDATVNYLKKLYTNRVDAKSLEKLTGTRFEELDRQYHKYLKTGQ